MTCDEQRLVAFLAGELTPAESAEVDAHLIACERCWREVAEDRAGRAAAEAMRVAPAPALAERVRLAIALADEHPAPRRRSAPRRRLLRVLTPIALAAAVTVGVLAVRDQQAPASLEAIVAHAAGSGGVSRIDSFAIAGVPIVVAHPAVGVEMPTEAVSEQGSNPAVWVMEDQGVTIVCSRRTGALIAGRASAATLMAAAQRLGL